MFVQKKYPKVEYTMHVELFQHEVEKLLHEVTLVNEVINRYYRQGGARAFPTLHQFLLAIKQEAESSPYREC